MKLKYFLPAFMAIVAMFTGCNEDYEAARLSDLQVSSSFLTLPAEGGTAELQITANAAWELTDIPEWLTIAPTSGEAGTTAVSVTAEKTTKTLEAVLKLVSNGMTQEINIKQALENEDADPITVAEAVALIKAGQGGTAKVKGIVCKIDEISTQYGNATYYLSDDGTYGEGNWLEVYRGRWLDGEKFTKGDEFAVGDVIIVRGTLKDYKGTPEVDTGSEVISIEKSLLGVESVEMEGDKLPVEGGDFKVNLTNKGQGLNVVIPDDAKSWLYVTGININGEKTIVSFHATANTGGERSAVLGFTTTDGTKQYNAETTIVQTAFALPHGQTAEDPFTVAEAIAKCIAIGNTSDGIIYYAKGVISSISGVDTGDYGNATFNISDDGTEAEGTVLTCYRSFFLDNQHFTSQDQIAVGDEVVMCGKLVNYKNKEGVETPEFSGNVYVYSYKKVTNDPGTKNNPFTPAQANAFCKTLQPGKDNATTEDYYIKGKIIDITDSNQFGTQYGNCTFYISDDGTDKEDKFLVYRCYYLGNVKYTDDTWIKPAKGDDVVICGKLMLYEKDGAQTPETVQGQAYIYSLNGKTN